MNPDASTDSDVARKQAQEALATSEARMHALLEVAVDGIISIDERGAIQTINPAAERLFGYTQDEVIGQNVKILMPSPYLEEHDGYLARYLATGEKRIIGIVREVLGRRKDGMTFPMDLFVAEARLGDERIFVGIIPTAIIHFTCVDQYSFPLETKGSGDTMAESTKANGSS